MRLWKRAGSRLGRVGWNATIQIYDFNQFPLGWEGSFGKVHICFRYHVSARSGVGSVGLEGFWFTAVFLFVLVYGSTGDACPGVPIGPMLVN